MAEYSNRKYSTLMELLDPAKNGNSGYLRCGVRDDIGLIMFSKELRMSSKEEMTHAPWVNS